MTVQLFDLFIIYKCRCYANRAAFNVKLKSFIGN